MIDLNGGESHRPSRREFIGLSATSLLFLTACGPDEPVNAGSEKAGDERALASPGKSVAAADWVVAAQVAAAVLSIASSVNSMFFSGRDIKRELKAIQRQNAEIIRLLGSILNVLNNLGVVIQQAVLEQFQRQTLRTLNATFVEIIENRLAEEDDPTYRDEAVGEYRRLLVDVKNLSRQLARHEDFGFGIFDAVGHGMFMELWLSQRVGIHPARIGQSASTYAEYFTAVLHPGQAGSPGAQLAKARERLGRFDRTLSEADALAARATPVIVQRRKEIRKRGRQTFYADVQQILTGSRQTGYSHSEKYVNEVVVESPGPDGPRGDPGGARGGQKFLVQPDPTDSGDPTPAGRSTYFNSIRAAHAELERQMPALATVAQTAQVYLDTATRLRSRT